MGQSKRSGVAVRSNFMRRITCILSVLVGLTWALCVAGCQSVEPVTAVASASPTNESGAADLAGVAATATNAHARFDYYVLALSWSPQHCATPAGRRDAVQCAGTRPYSFIVHGLWPQYERGWPQDCPSDARLSGKVVHDALDIMPSQSLIRHEWSKHGTCSGLTPEAYFALARTAFRQFQAPADYGTPDREIYVSPAKYKTAWMQANTGLQASQFAINCTGRYLQEVRICLDKNLRPRPCGADVRDRCRVPEMIVRPLR